MTQMTQMMGTTTKNNVETSPKREVFCAQNKLTEYEASQIQRYHERQIRRWKREYAAMDAAGLDTTEAAVKIRSWNERQNDFIRQTGFKRQADQEQTAMRRTTRGRKKDIENNKEPDIIKSNITGNGGADVHHIGRLNRSIYRCVTNDIVTDEVIITDKQIQHIKDRHPNDFERYCSYFREIVSNPDYIIEANKPNSALVLKEIMIHGEVFKMVVRLATSQDDPKYKNSIITFMKIDRKEWNRLLRNKRILYKKE